MLYNNGYPATYQQYQPTYQQNTPMYQQSYQQNGLIWVQGEAAAKSYPVAPNTSVALWDSEANVVYIKTVDASGMPSMKIADYTMRDNTPKSTQTASQSDFATKDDLLPIKKDIDALKAKLEGEEDVE